MKIDIHDDWEKHLREKLEDELSDTGIFVIFVNEAPALVNKENKIEFEIQYQKELRRLMKNN